MLHTVTHFRPVRWQAGLVWVPYSMVYEPHQAVPRSCLCRQVRGIDRVQTNNRMADLHPVLALEQEVHLSDKCHRQEMVAVLDLSLIHI